MSAELRDALDAAVAGLPVAELAAAVSALIGRYRASGPVEPERDRPILGDPVDIAAYAAYRMPATYAAVRAALTRAARAVPAFRPVGLLDLGGGTGAASWAATDVFPSLRSVTVLDQVPGAIELGRRLGANRAVLRSARWERWRVAEGRTFADTDLATISYVLGELRPTERSAVLAAAAGPARAVLVVEPGTPAGYARVLVAREELRAAGLSIGAPCPHEQPCPLAGPDWCHFAVRVNRSALHRRLKGATLGYEDEKFSYVFATRDRVAAPTWSRVLRHPARRKGLVQMRLCRPEGTAADEIVSKRSGERYRAARDVSWGDAWPG